MKKFAFTISLSAGLAASAFGNFTKTVSFTTSGYRGSSPLEDFPVLVKLSDAIEGFDYGDFGTDTNLVFKDAGGNTLPYEIDTWDTSGTSLVWVRVPSLTATTSFTMFYCGSDTVVNNPTNTWTGANYVGVWHMNEQNGTVADATGHGLAATPSGNASVSIRYTRTEDVPVGHARETGVSGTKGYLSIPSYDTFNVGDTFTMSGWVRLHTRTGSPRLFSRKSKYNTNNGWEFEMSSSDQNFQARGAAQDKNMYSGSFASTLHRNWTHVALVYDGSTLTVYGNGVVVKSASTITPATDNGLSLAFGCNSGGSESAFVEGAFDECRLLDAVASADWIAAEYATVKSNDFVIAGAVADVAPTLGAVVVTPESDRAALSGTIASSGAGATTCDVYLAIGPSADALGAATKIATATTDSFEYTIRNLSENTTFFYELSVTNNAASPAGAATRGSFTTSAFFARKVTFTVNYTNENDLSGIPVLVRLSAGSPEGFSYRECAPDGSDIRFFDADRNAIPHDIDTWNPNGESLVWVKVQSVACGATFSMAYKGTPGAANTPQAVWADYTGVWHLNDLGADNAETWYSQGLYPNSTAETGIDGHLSTNSIPNETGRFGKAFRVNASTGSSAANYNEGGVWIDDTGEDSPLDAGGVFTISGWFKHKDFNYNWDKMFFKRFNDENDTEPIGAFAVRIGAGDGTTKVAVRGATGSNRVRLDNAEDRKFSMIGNWIYLTVVFNGKSISIYENGELCKTGNNLTAAGDNNAPLVFGNNVGIARGASGSQAWNGWIDEVRYLKAAKSAEWIAAEYAAMADVAEEPFVTAGAVEKIGNRHTLILLQ